MPNQSGNTKRKKRNERIKINEASQPADASSSELSCAVGAEASSISGDRELSETKENLTGYFVIDTGD
jgi:hypothetical protein